MAVVLDLTSRVFVGWSTGSQIRKSLVLNAMRMVQLSIRPKDSVMIHLDQVSQFDSDEFRGWFKDNRLSPSMIRRGNCGNNAMFESFFTSLKSKRIKKRIQQTRSEAKTKIFNYTEDFYSRVEPHKCPDKPSHHEFEQQRQAALSKVS